VPSPRRLASPATGPAQTQRRPLIDGSHPLHVGLDRRSEGVVITHANVISFVEWAVSYFGIRPSDRVRVIRRCTSTCPPSTSTERSPPARSSTWCRLVSASTPHRLAALIRESELTQWFSVPSVLTYRSKSDAVAQDDFPPLERVIWCREVLPTPVLEHWMKRLPHAA
jgi:non-ribosomal peptide synthetase component F